MNGETSVVWFRRDLRLADNPALEAAVRAGGPVVPVFVLDEGEGVRPLGGASRWWLDKSLRALAADLERLGSKLILRRGPAALVVPALAAEVGAGRVLWNAVFDPGATQADADLAHELGAQGVQAKRFNGGHLVNPAEVKTKTGGPYGVFTPFWRTASAMVQDKGLHPRPSQPPAPAAWPASDRLDDWRLHPVRPDWSAGFDWTPGEAGAAERLAEFLNTRLAAYPEIRDIPAMDGSSRLSPHLHFGEISPHRIWRAAHEAVDRHKALAAARDKFLAELGWREFNTHILQVRGDLANENFNRAFDGFEWRDDDAALEAWRRGRTGYPIVDAGMRELWTTGFMHNRVRMIVASFLTKHLMIDWRQGERWFWDTLVDADHASNAGNWQWVAGCGADAAPYFRIFNPTAQGQKFDPQGAYVRRWVPELARLPDAHIHTPWLAPADVRRLAGGYPDPIVDHAFARNRALAAYAEMRGQRPD